MLNLSLLQLSIVIIILVSLFLIFVICIHHKYYYRNIQKSVDLELLSKINHFKTKEEMKNLDEKIIPNGCIMFCKEDSSFYQYFEHNRISKHTGRWRKKNK